VGQAPPAPPRLCWQPGRDGEATCRPATLCPRRCHLRNNFGFEVQQKELILTLPTPRARIPARTHLVLRVGRVCSLLSRVARPGTEQGCPQGVDIKAFMCPLIFPQIAGPSWSKELPGGRGICFPASPLSLCPAGASVRVPLGVCVVTTCLSPSSLTQ